MNEQNEVDIHKSEHTMAIQRSCYLCIDDNLDKSKFLGAKANRQVVAKQTDR